MCIIIYKPKGKTLDIDTIKNCWDRNPDGAGVMFRCGDKTLTASKGFMKLKSFRKYLLKNLLLDDETETAIHLRIATHGAVTEGNCHPFFNKNFAIMHNGILSGFGSKDYSDTKHFFEVLSRMSPEDRLPLLDMASDNNKFCLWQNGEFKLFGNFIEDKGVYYSNSGYKPLSFFYNCKPSKYSNTYVYNNEDYAKLSEYKTKCDICGTLDWANKIDGIDYCEDCLTSIDYDYLKHN